MSFDFPEQSYPAMAWLGANKLWWLKLATLGAAGLGALMMAVFRPPVSRREMFMQAFVALGCSLLFGNTLAFVINHALHIFDPRTAPASDVLQYEVAVHGLLGAVSWGVFGAIAAFRDNPTALIERLRKK